MPFRADTSTELGGPRSTRTSIPASASMARWLLLRAEGVDEAVGGGGVGEIIGSSGCGGGDGGEGGDGGGGGDGAGGEGDSSKLCRSSSMGGGGGVGVRFCMRGGKAGAAGTG